jgi:hypothetical protein
MNSWWYLTAQFPFQVLQFFIWLISTVFSTLKEKFWIFLHFKFFRYAFFSKYVSVAAIILLAFLSEIRFPLISISVDALLSKGSCAYSQALSTCCKKLSVLSLIFTLQYLNKPNLSPLLSSKLLQAMIPFIHNLCSSLKEKPFFIASWRFTCLFSH